jgi:hypothetical protein
MDKSAEAVLTSRKGWKELIIGRTRYVGGEYRERKGNCYPSSDLTEDVNSRSEQQE